MGRQKSLGAPPGGWRSPAWAEPVLFALGAAALASFLAIPFVPGEIEVYSDVFRVLEQASCLANGVRRVPSSPSSAGLHQGLAWSHVVSLFLRWRLPLEGLFPLLLGLFAAGAGALAWAVRSLAGRWLALPLIAGYCALAVGSSLFAPLWEPIAAPGAAALLVGAVCFATHGSARRPPRASARGARGVVGWIAVGLLLAIATQIHVVFLLFLPGFILAGRIARHLAASLVCLVLLAGAWALLSPMALEANLAFLGHGSMSSSFESATDRFGGVSLEAVGLLVAGLVVLVPAFAPRLRAPTSARAIWVLTGTTAATLGAGLFAVGTGAAPRYVTPLLPFAVASVAALNTLPSARTRNRFRKLGGRWIAPATSVAATAALLLALPAPPTAFGGTTRLALGDVIALRAAVEQEVPASRSALDLLSIGQGYLVPLYEALGRRPDVGLPGGPESALAGARSKLAVIAVPRGEAVELPSSPTWRRVAGRQADFLLIRVEPYVETSTFAVCEPPGTGGDACDRRSLTIPPPPDGGACPDVGCAHAARTIVRRTDVPRVLRFDVRVPVGGRPHRLLLPSVDVSGFPRPRCAPTIVAVEGAPAEVAPDGRSVRLVPPERGPARPGTLAVRWPTGDRKCFPDGRSFFPMPMLELDEADFQRVRPFLGRWPTAGDPAPVD